MGNTSEEIPTRRCGLWILKLICKELYTQNMAEPALEGVTYSRAGSELPRGTQAGWGEWGLKSHLYPTGQFFLPRVGL